MRVDLHVAMLQFSEKSDLSHSEDLPMWEQSRILQCRLQKTGILKLNRLFPGHLYRAKTKGKVERFNHYLKNSFVTPLSVDLRQANLELDCQIANGKIGQWLEEVAHQRIHGTTGEKPQERLIHERDCLSSLPQHIHAKQPDCNGSETIKLALPTESHVMQHPIHIYDDIAGGCYAGI